MHLFSEAHDWLLHAKTLDEMWLEGLKARDSFRWLDPDVPEPMPPD